MELKVYVLSYNAGVLGVYKSKAKAILEKADYKRYDYKGLKIDEFNVYE